LSTLYIHKSRISNFERKFMKAMKVHESSGRDTKNLKSLFF
jgi:hypothetical protein